MTNPSILPTSQESPSNPWDYSKVLREYTLSLLSENGLPLLWSNTWVSLGAWETYAWFQRQVWAFFLDSTSLPTRWGLSVGYKDVFNWCYWDVKAYICRKRLHCHVNQNSVDVPGVSHLPLWEGTSFIMNNFILVDIPGLSNLTNMSEKLRL